MAKSVVTAARMLNECAINSHEHFRLVGDTDFVCIRRDLLKHVGMGDQPVGDLWVTWPNDAVIYAVDMCYGVSNYGSFIIW